MRTAQKHNSRMIVISDLTGGVNTAVAKELIADNEMPYCENMVYTLDGHRLKRRGGLSPAIAIFNDNILGAYYDYEMNIFLTALENRDLYKTDLTATLLLGQLSGSLRPRFCKFGGSALVTSGDKLQIYDYVNFFTVTDSPICDSVLERFGRIVVYLAGDDNIYYSSVGDAQDWLVNNVASGAKVLEIGYQDGGDLLVVLPLATDLVAIKSNGKVFQIGNEYPDWTVFEVARNVDCDYRFCAEQAGSDILFVGRRGLNAISTTTEYGNIRVNDLGAKFNSLLAQNIYHPTVWNIRRKKLFLIRPYDGPFLVAFDYVLGAATWLKFPGMVREVMDTPNGIVVAIGNNLHYWDDQYDTDYGNPVVGSFETKDFITPSGGLVLKKVDAAFESSSAGTAEIGVSDIGYIYEWSKFSSKRFVERCNHRIESVQVEMKTTSSCALQHVILEVADVR